MLKMFYRFPMLACLLAMIDSLGRWMDAMSLNGIKQTKPTCTLTSHSSHLIYMPEFPTPTPTPTQEFPPDTSGVRRSLPPLHTFPTTTSPLHINLTLNLHLNGPRLRIRRRLKRTNRILQIKPMRHQLLQRHNPTLNQPNRSRPRIRIPVLELQIDFLR